MASDEVIVCAVALAALLEGDPVDDWELTVKQWEAAQTLYAALPEKPASEEDTVLKMALAFLIGDPLPTPRRTEQATAERILTEYAALVEARP